MSLGAEVDAGIDLGPFSLEAIAGLKASLDGLAQQIKKARDTENAYQWGVRELPLRNSAVSNSDGDTLVIDMGGPPPMRMWEVKRLTVGGALWTDTPDGSAVIVVSPAGGQVTPSTADAADYAGSFPTVAYYSTRQLTLRNPNRLYVVILSPAASTQYAVGGQTSDFPDRRLLLDTEN